MNPTAYIETSVVSYLTAWPSRDVVIAAYQQVTREWWRTAGYRFDLVASELVVAEAGAGDVDAAELTQRLLDVGAVPHNAAEDAAHIAIAVTNGIDYLVTWNFRHIANAAMRSRIERVCRLAGYEPVVICTPNELMEPDHADPTD